MLEESHRNLLKYDLIVIFTTLVSKDKAFDEGIGNNDYGKLKVTAEGKPITYDLSKNCLQVTAEQAASSSTYYAEFFPEEHLMQQNLTWSFAYYEKNVDKDLYSAVHSNTTGDANLKSLIYLLETYKIQTNSKGEYIPKVVTLFRAAFSSIKELKQGGDLPDDSVKAMRKAGAQVLANEIESVKYILEYANAAYEDLTKDGKWNEVLQRAPGEASFVSQADCMRSARQQPTTFSQSANGASQSPPPGVWKSFNCGKPGHMIKDCPEPRDSERIQRNRAMVPA
eukprot:jgi/Psemu1/328251/estExt_fgenesh1_pg.C_11190003